VIVIAVRRIRAILASAVVARRQRVEGAILGRCVVERHDRGSDGIVD
jgi:hypothetical protein